MKVKRSNALFCEKSAGASAKRHTSSRASVNVRPGARNMTSLHTQIEAFAFRSLLAHLRTRTDVQNIDVMNLAGFCRNCLAKWTLLGAQKVGYSMTYDEACEYVYGEPYATWKTKYQAKATPEQLEAFAAGAAGHAKHGALDMDKANSHTSTTTAGVGLQPIAADGLSEVCCTPADELLGGGACAVGGGFRAARVGGSSTRVGILTVSDRASAGTYADESGPTIERVVREYALASGAFDISEVSTALVPDDEVVIERALVDLTSRCDIVFTTGGTGCAPRDVTPEATTRVLAREIPGLPEAIRAATAVAEPHALLSRAVAGVAHSGAFVLNLPGRPHACRQNLSIALPLISHLLSTMRE